MAHSGDRSAFGDQAQGGGTMARQYSEFITDSAVERQRVWGQEGAGSPVNRHLEVVCEHDYVDYIPERCHIKTKEFVDRITMFFRSDNSLPCWSPSLPHAGAEVFKKPGRLPRSEVTVFRCHGMYIPVSEKKEADRHEQELRNRSNSDTLTDILSMRVKFAKLHAGSRSFAHYSETENNTTLHRRFLNAYLMGALRNIVRSSEMTSKDKSEALRKLNEFVHDVLNDSSLINQSNSGFDVDKHRNLLREFATRCMMLCNEYVRDSKANRYRELTEQLESFTRALARSPARIDMFSLLLAPDSDMPYELRGALASVQFPIVVELKKLEQGRDSKLGEYEEFIRKHGGIDVWVQMAEKLSSIAPKVAVKKYRDISKAETNGHLLTYGKDEQAQEAVSSSRGCDAGHGELQVSYVENVSSMCNAIDRFSSTLQSIVTLDDLESLIERTPLFRKLKESLPRQGQSFFDKFKARVAFQLASIQYAKATCALMKSVGNIVRHGGILGAASARDPLVGLFRRMKSVISVCHTNELDVSRNLSRIAGILTREANMPNATPGVSHLNVFTRLHYYLHDVQRSEDDSKVSLPVLMERVAHNIDNLCREDYETVYTLIDELERELLSPECLDSAFEEFITSMVYVSAAAGDSARQCLERLDTVRDFLSECARNTRSITEAEGGRISKVGMIRLRDENPDIARFLQDCANGSPDELVDLLRNLDKLQPPAVHNAEESFGFRRVLTGFRYLDSGEVEGHAATGGGRLSLEGDPEPVASDANDVRSAPVPGSGAPTPFESLSGDCSREHQDASACNAGAGAGAGAGSPGCSGNMFF